MIDQLLEKFDTLTDIAVELYGEGWVAEDQFWGSPTELEMQNVQESLLNLGYKFDEPSEAQIEAAIQIVSKLS
jgi:hypothetical protein